jgi:hypothetical protein
MSTLEALYFPGTEIYSGSQFPIFLLLQKTHLLQPVESTEISDNAADIFKTTGLCQAHTPCPLGENRDRFLRLIRDIRERKDDYAAQLSSLTVAALSNKKASVEDSSRGIITSLLGGHGVAPTAQEDRDLQLWQARLVLKIGEILDREEEEVAMQMAVLEDEEDGLFKTLQGELEDEEESLFEELQQLKETISRPTATTIKNRLGAWSRLYRAGTVTSQKIWLTHMEEAADILLEKYEDLNGSAASIVAELELPANIGWGSADAIEQIQSFREQNDALLGRIQTTLAAAGDEDIKPLITEWAAALQKMFPSEKNGRTTLTFYNLGDHGCPVLFGNSADATGSLLGVVRWPR